ncbi:hypothetical protein BGZ70_006705, partial [Mortierella alpina]
MKIEERELDGNNAILQYMRLNESRPESERWSFFSRPALGDRFVKFSDDGLRRALLAPSSPVRKAMEGILLVDEDVVFELFFAKTRHGKVTMSMKEFKDDKDGTKTRLERLWAERKGTTY